MVGNIARFTYRSAMASYSFEQFTPRVHPSAYVHPTAQLLGDVSIAEEASVWPGTVLRGDSGAITIGARTNVQDGCIGHATGGVSVTTIGAHCTIGHRVILHGCTVADHCLVGMASTLLDNVVLGAWCFVAAGTLLTPGKVFEPRSFIMGSPGRRVREVSAKELEAIEHGAHTYVALARRYR